MKFEDIEEIGRRAEEGAWVSDLANLNGVSLKVRAQMSSPHEKLFSELWSKVPPDKREDPEITEAIESAVVSFSPDEPRDDIAIMAVRLSGGTGAETTSTVAAEGA